MYYDDDDISHLIISSAHTFIRRHVESITMRMQQLKNENKTNVKTLTTRNNGKLTSMQYDCTTRTRGEYTRHLRRERRAHKPKREARGIKSTNRMSREQHHLQVFQERIQVGEVPKQKFY